MANDEKSPLRAEFGTQSDPTLIGDDQLSPSVDEQAEKIEAAIDSFAEGMADPDVTPKMLAELYMQHFTSFLALDGPKDESSDIELFNAENFVKAVSHLMPNDVWDELIAINETKLGYARELIEHFVDFGLKKEGSEDFTLAVSEDELRDTVAPIRQFNVFRDVHSTPGLDSMYEDFSNYVAEVTEQVKQSREVASVDDSPDISTGVEPYGEVVVQPSPQNDGIPTI